MRYLLIFIIGFTTMSLKADSKKILILGGTQFLGKTLAQEAIARGHTLTLFHRGETNPGIFPEAEEIFGNRYDDLSPLSGRTWDYVIDTSGNFPSNCAQTASFLNNQASSYIFISSCSVYKDLSQAHLNEKDSLAEMPSSLDPDLDSSDATYGARKALCEKEVAKNFLGKVLIIRPGLIVGPDDPTNRFSYWVRLIGKEEQVAVPNDESAFCQWIDVRDLARWIMDMVEREEEGTYNAVGEKIRLKEFFEECARISGCKLEWSSFEGKRRWYDVPLWLPEGLEGMFQIDGARAYQKNLTLLPLEDTFKTILSEGV